MPQPKFLYRFVIFCVLLLLTGCGLLQTPIRDPLRGSCQCPYDLDRAGRVCGEKSSYSRPGGDRPVCYIGEGSAPSTDEKNLALGNPSNANNRDRNNYLMVKPQYALAYNSSTGTANWASWHLDRAWMGRAERQNDFRPDDTLPADWYRVGDRDYRGSGYDRGHLVPSADRTRRNADNSATFLMTNIIPQHPENNREVWRELEEYCRDLVSAGKELYIVAGPEGRQETIARGKIVAPKYTWKAILVLDRPGDPVTEQTRAIAVRIPNSAEVKNRRWQDYLVSIDVIEAATGYDLFSKVPRNVQAVVESRVE
ncbi:MAG: DNA/RNA non-specific endonuclease [Cyanobacteriota bacterium]|nr:DNA/RNA non-specific endonuclease [Cyanobacteriota bacterium]